MAASRMIVGLGNPGPEYEETRHNIGFAVIDEIIASCKVEIDAPPRGIKSWFSGSPADGARIIGWGSHRARKFGVLKPMTYMNRSGEVVSSVLGKQKLTPDDIIVIVDDINLPLGSIRIRKSGGAGGHNGLQNIIDCLNSDKFPRMRFGVDSSFGTGRQADYVLSPFGEEELDVVQETIGIAKAAALTFITDGVTTAMNRYNRTKRDPESPSKEADA